MGKQSASKSSSPSEQSVEFEKQLVIDPTTGKITVRVNADAGALSGNTHTSYAPDGTLTSGYSSSVEGVVLKVGLTNDINENQITGETGESSSIRLSRTLHETDYTKLEGFIKGGVSNTTQASALDPELIIHHDSIKTVAGLAGAVSVDTPGVFDKVQLQSEVDFGVDLSDDEIINESTGEEVFSSTGGSLHLGSIKFGDNLLDMTPAELQSEHDRLQVGIENLELNNNEGAYSDRLDAWQTSQQHLQLAETFVVAEQARTDVLTGGEEGWQVKSWDEPNDVIQYSNDDGTSLYIDRNSHQAVYVRADGETSVVNYTEAEQPIVAQYNLPMDGLTLGMGGIGLPVIETHGQTLLISPDFIYQQKPDGNINLTTYDAQGQASILQTTVKEVMAEVPEVEQPLFEETDISKPLLTSEISLASDRSDNGSDLSAEQNGHDPQILEQVIEEHPDSQFNADAKVALEVESPEQRNNEQAVEALALEEKIEEEILIAPPAPSPGE